ncbi:MAG: [protein-PII] uridylyltransferase [Burkholderiales bacterium]
MSSAVVKPDPAAAWKRSLAARRHELQREFEGNFDSARLFRAQRQTLDQVLQAIWRERELPESLALFAVGGYGRGQLYPYSDVDLLVLLPDSADSRLQGQLERMVGLLWDIGLEVGHSVRTIAECLTAAKSDITVHTNLLEARLLIGPRKFAVEFSRAIHGMVEPQAYFNAKQVELRARHSRFNDTAYNLEPNLKDSPGGLRDLQHILWISDAADFGANWRELADVGILRAKEVREIANQERFLQGLRIRLHYLAERREDRLLFEHQSELARQLGFFNTPERRASEQLMQRYYESAKAVTQFNLLLTQTIRARIFPAAQQTVSINERFAARNDLLEARSESLFSDEPAAILECFQLLQQRPELKGIGAATARELWRAADKVDANFRRGPGNRARFLSLLRAPAGVTRELRRMNQYGILGRYIPPFGRIVGRMQHDLFHVYTVDEHILRVVRNVRRFTRPEFAHEYPLASRLIADFERPEVLVLAALFHDIAKGRGGDHSRLGSVDARRFCKAHGLAKPDADLVAWLVENHLLMSATAQKQDLADPEVISQFAGKVRDLRSVTALYILTVADIRATSPKVWNAWKGKLLADLFFATRSHLGGVPPSSVLQARRDEALELLRLDALPKNLHEKLWEQLETSYFLRHDPQEIAWHVRLLNYRVKTPSPVVKARLSSEGLQVMIYTKDEKDLFARICGFFQRVHYSIVEAKIYTTRHGYALDTFQVMDPQGETLHYRDLIGYIEHDLAEEISRGGPLPAPVQGRLSRQLKHLPITPEVSLTSDDKGAYHILSVIAGDRPGLLFRIARVLSDYNINLRDAKIATLGERAEDTFLINGEILSNARAVMRFENDLLQALQVH